MRDYVNEVIETKHEYADDAMFEMIGERPEEFGMFVAQLFDEASSIYRDCDKQYKALQALSDILHDVEARRSGRL